MTLPSVPWQFWGQPSKKKVGSGPVPGNPHPFSEIVEQSTHSLAYKINQPIKTNHTIFGATLTFWDGPYSVCGVCFSLNKSTSCLSLCLSLNNFCDETSRTWASLSPETRCCSQWILADFESQSELYGLISNLWFAPKAEDQKGKSVKIRCRKAAFCF